MNRTCDLRFRKPSLYPLSYGGKQWCALRYEIAVTPRAIYQNDTHQNYARNYQSDR